MRLLFALTLMTASITACAQTGTKEISVVFEGTTPCSNFIRPIHKIITESDCHLNECQCLIVEWKLTLYSDPAGAPGKYTLTGLSRHGVKETNMYSEPGTPSESEGYWAVVKSEPAIPGSTVYELNPDKPRVSLKLVRLSDDVLHILDNTGRLMIGNEFHSYTLTRTKN